MDWSVERNCIGIRSPEGPFTVTSKGEPARLGDHAEDMDVAEKQQCCISASLLDFLCAAAI
jgi:hypothetical protein